MLVGNPDLFAVDWKIETIHQSWVLGKFKFIINSGEVGNWDDTAALNAIFGWIDDFVKQPIDRIEENNQHLSKEQIFSSLYDPFRVYKVTLLDADFFPSEPERRFHLSYLGMSSFDDWGILLIETTEHQRILWCDLRSKSIFEARLPLGTIQSVFAESSQKFYEEVQNL